MTTDLNLNPNSIDILYGWVYFFGCGGCNPMDRVLIVEDSDSLRDSLKMLLEREGYDVEARSNAEDALCSISDKSFSLILSDYKLPGLTGIDFLKKARDKSPSVPFLVMTAFGSIDLAVEAMKFGANDFLPKPFEPSQLCSVVRDMVNHQRVLDRSTGRTARRKRPIITQNPTFLSILEQTKKVARFDTPVLILGESGVGKELLARHIHEHSPRKDEKFISVNCAAIPAQLLESEFFGHEAGAFTSATQSRPGLFEIAKNGTIFLDEVGDMPKQLQVKLLRALQEGEIRRVGGNTSIKINPRIIAATNQSLDNIANSSLREDFYYRLAVFSVTIPPLRERKEDLEILVKAFLEDFCEAGGVKAPEIDPETWELINNYNWPGNVRELENIMERASLLAQGKLLPEHLGINPKIDFNSINEILTSLPEVAEKASRIAEIEMIKKILQKTAGNKSRAAEVLGVSYKTLLNKCKEYEIS
jgi:two-component system response regulator AtoC